MGITRTTRLGASDRPGPSHHAATPRRPRRALRSPIARVSGVAVMALVMATLAMIGAPTAALAHTDVASGDWRLQNPAKQHPSPRSVWASMAPDLANGTVVLFGGPVDAVNGAYNGDTWTWDGARWTERHPAHHPSARGAAAMAYDPATRGVVLFGVHSGDCGHLFRLIPDGRSG
jgi:hypothetical protein